MQKRMLFINTYYNNISKINNNNKIKKQINQKNFIKNNENKNK